MCVEFKESRGGGITRSVGWYCLRFQWDRLRQIRESSKGRVWKLRGAPGGVGEKSGVKSNARVVLPIMSTFTRTSKAKSFRFDGGVLGVGYHAHIESKCDECRTK